MKAKSIFIFLLWALVSASIASSVDAFNHVAELEQGSSDTPFFLRAMGEARSIVSAGCVLQADRYFHGGLGHYDEEHRGGLSIEKGEGAVDEDPEEHTLSEIASLNILTRVAGAIGVTEHVHLKGEGLKEIVPWMYYAAEIDPHNVRAYGLVAYYLADRLGKISEALEYLRKGIRENPGSWELNADTGRLYYKHIKDYRTAERYFLRALALLETEQHDKFQERYVLSFITHTYEAMGEDQRALPYYIRMNRIFPRDYFEKRIKELGGTI